MVLNQLEGKIRARFDGMREQRLRRGSKQSHLPAVAVLGFTNSARLSTWTSSLITPWAPSPTSPPPSFSALDAGRLLIINRRAQHGAVEGTVKCSASPTVARPPSSRPSSLDIASLSANPEKALDADLLLTISRGNTEQLKAVLVKRL